MQIVHFMPAFTSRFLALLVLFAGLESHALTLGRLQGAALIGRSLDVSIQVQLDPGQSISSPCFEADVFHGDTRQNPGRVQLRVEPMAAPDAVRLRIQSQSPIDEPIVTIYLRAGCAQMVSRRYVMLADIVSEQAAPLAPREVAVPLIASPAPASAAPAAVPSTGAGTGATAVAPKRATTADAPDGVRQSADRRARQQNAGAKATPRSKSAVAKSKKAPVATPASAPPAVAAPPAQAVDRSAGGAAAGQSRLKLDPLELLSERVATLESTTSVVQSEAAIRDAQRLESLEASIKTLVTLSARNEASLLEIRARLQQVQDDRYNNPVVYLLAALLLASLFAIVYLLTRRQRHVAAGENWWDGAATVDPAPRPVQPPEPPSGPAPLTAPSALSRPDALPSAPDRLEQADTQPTAQQPATRAPAAGGTPVDVSLVEMSESTFDRLMQSGAQHSAVRIPPVTVPAATHETEPETGSGDVESSRRMRINSDELIDIRQRAEFFVTLGQTDQAVQILENRIAQDGESSPQAYLDLLNLFHALGLKADYRQVRDDFSLLFNARVPEFADFAKPNRALEDYPAIIDRLITVWSTDKALDTLEDLMFRRDDDADAELFDLEAFRELLTLHAVAQAVLSDGVQATGGVVGTSFPELDPQGVLDIDLSAPVPFEPRSTSPRAARRTESPVAQEPPAGNLIDFDLSEFPPHKSSDRD